MSDSMVNAASSASVNNSAALIMLRKSMDIQAQGALSLLQAIPQPAPVNPPNLGQNIDTRA
ncbi:MULTISPECIES: YjfB family protein [Deefgea]|uniref:Motility protein n=1 Tax=Deefgea chitinilytica TaxID=570276 RepID=A0ABS2C800_9NEIS|nr:MULTISPECIES: YjfB family protein [Deefgea]MBM5570287.1 putative motility protein [Deefgea chitinilytica]MBM9887516.1 YjfB family protein [Deefgea sp. CFH1-16]